MSAVNETASDVVIVGGGPVGLVNALALGREGFTVRVIEAQTDVSDEPRAMVYNWSVLDGLESLGLLEDAKEIGFVSQNVHYLVLATGEAVDLDFTILEGKVKHPYNLHLGQDKMVRLLLDHLKQHPNVTIEWGTTVTALAQDADGVSVEADSPTGSRVFRGSWAIGTDGARSTVRKQLGVEFEGLTWPHRFVATNVRIDLGARGYLPVTYQVDRTYGAVVSQIDTTGLWRVTYCEDSALPEEGVGDRIPDFFRAMLGEDVDYGLELYSAYRMHQRVAQTLRVGRVVLAGDAAHATNPTSGFGLTSGLYDTYALYPTLAAIIRGEASPDLLDVYSEDRRQAFLNVVSPVSTETKRIIFVDDPDRLGRDLVELRRVAASPDLQLEKFMAGQAIGTPTPVDQQLTNT